MTPAPDNLPIPSIGNNVASAVFGYNMYKVRRLLLKAHTASSGTPNVISQW